MAEKVKHTRRRKDVTDTSSPKHCKICGAIAINYNFGVQSCESCKAFFRRNANNQVSLQYN